jgi:hypothetical protein
MGPDDVDGVLVGPPNPCGESYGGCSSRQKLVEERAPPKPCKPQRKYTFPPELETEYIDPWEDLIEKIEQLKEEHLMNLIRPTGFESFSPYEALVMGQTMLLWEFPPLEKMPRRMGLDYCKDRHAALVAIQKDYLDHCKKQFIH